MTGHLCRLGLMLWLGLALPGMATATDARQTETGWQDLPLLKPADSQLAREELGQVFIYDGLGTDRVQRAMDEQFDPAKDMTYMRIHHLRPSRVGAVEVEED